MGGWHHCYVARWTSLVGEARDAVASDSLTSNNVLRVMQNAVNASFNTMRIFGHGDSDLGFVLQTGPGVRGIHSHRNHDILLLILLVVQSGCMCVQEQQDGSCWFSLSPPLIYMHTACMSICLFFVYLSIQTCLGCHRLSGQAF
jgi:hypothetical protein